MSRELDAMMASKLFGFAPKFVFGEPENCPRYSTDIAAAWLVVEKMKELGYPFELGDAEEGYYATYWNETSAPVYGKSMPECICKAALKSAGVE